MNTVINSTTTELERENLNSFLIIGYGSLLRGDDGIGQRVAEVVEQWNLPHVRSHSVHQLTPELAAEIARARQVVFVDAARGDWDNHSRSVQIEPLEAAETTTLRLGHDAQPRSLLSLTRTLYHQTPQAWLISIPGINFELSETLSPFAEKGVNDALELLKQWVNQ